MTLKPWREIAVPHEDVLKGTFQESEFAADITQVYEGKSSAEYQDPVKFFARTFITEGMRLLLDSVVRRLGRKGGDPVIQLQTAFGGGKTHTMLAVYHLVRGEVPFSELHGVSRILDEAGVTDLPKARVAVIDGIRLSPSQPKQRGGVRVHSLWGELAWQLGGEQGYQLFADSDKAGTSPGKELLVQLLEMAAPCVILIDELVAYLRQFEEGKSYPAGTFDSNLSFLQALTEGLKAVPNAMLLASLPESHTEVGSTRGQKALDALEKLFGRVQAIWKPVATEEAFEIVRRRLFERIGDQRAMEEACRAFADYYMANSDDFPSETLESRYHERLKRAYPIHPEIFDRLYEDWSTLDKFQRTRGVLQLLAQVIHRLWKDDNKDLMIMPGSLPLYDPAVRNKSIYYLPQGWDPVIERDIDGERAEPLEIDRDTRFGALQAARRTARTIFLGSAPSGTAQMVRGIELSRICLGSAQPGQQVAVYKDALRRLMDKLHYLNAANSRFWFDVRPNLRREMEDRKRRFDYKDEVLPEIRERVRQTYGKGILAAVHVFPQSSDVPDEYGLRLVVLPPDEGYSKGSENRAFEAAGKILRTRGEQPRQKQNRLLFLAADYDSVNRLKDQTRSYLAWKSIVDDVKEHKLNLDQYQTKQASQSQEEAKNSLLRMVREAYRWLLAPCQFATPGKGLSELTWEAVAISSGAVNVNQEIESKVRDNEWVITQWSPIHLVNMLRTWFWKEDVKAVGTLEVWEKTCNYLYLPRLLNEEIFKNAIAAGVDSQDFLGFANCREGEKYLGFSFGKQAIIFLDSAAVLIETQAAKSYLAKLRAEEETTRQPPPTGEAPAGPGAGGATSPGGYIAPAPKGESEGGEAIGTPAAHKKQFYGTINLDPIKAKLDFATIVEEVVQQFTARHNVNVTISIEIQAHAPQGFDEGLQRSVKENCNVLRFSSVEFEEG